MRMPSRLVRVSLVLAACAPVLMAHPGHGETGFVAGVAHPLLGWDHLLAMVTVGLLAARLGGAALWQLPASFLGCMLLGGLLGFAGMPLGFAEWGIALSVLVFGAMLALGTPPSRSLAMAVIGVFALLHGHAHAAEMAPGASCAAYAGGFVLATAMLHLLGLCTGILLRRTGQLSVLRLSGVVISASSLALVVDLLR
jgi:urease accessory protein